MMQKIVGLRWWIVGLICLGTIVNYLARNSLSVLAPQLQRELGFSAQQYSYVVAAFQVAYTVMLPVCGYALDRLGLQVGFALFAVLWSLANMLHALAASWPALALYRGLLGLTEAAAIPAGIKAVSEWFPPRERSVAVGYFNTGTSLGAMLAPPLVIGLATRNSWQAAFLVIGGAGLLWAVAWYRVYASPAHHPLLTQAEREHITPSGAPPPAVKPALASIARRRAFWGIALPRFLAEPAWQTFNFWIPLYLASERHLDLKQIATFAWLPFLAADLGAIAGGYLSPLLVRRLGLSLVRSRIVGVALGALCMLGPGCVGLLYSPYASIAMLCLGGFGHQMISALLNSLSVDVFAPSEVATANGLIGAAGWTGGLLFSLAVGALAGTIGYSPLFACLAGFDLLATVILVLLLREPAPQASLPPGARLHPERASPST
jgi:ACS family hexuronate transporter-like MFS transporter